MMVSEPLILVGLVVVARAVDVRSMSTEHVAPSLVAQNRSKGNQGLDSRGNSHVTSMSLNGGSVNWRRSMHVAPSDQQ